MAVSSHLSGGKRNFFFGKITPQGIRMLTARQSSWQGDGCRGGSGVFDCSVCLGDSLGNPVCVERLLAPGGFSIGDILVLAGNKHRVLSETFE